MAEDLENDEVLDEQDLEVGFDVESIEGDEFENIADEADEADDADETDDVVVADVIEAHDDDDDISLEHDVELALDEVLAETMRTGSESAEEEDEAPDEVDDKGVDSESVLPKQDDEFRCTFCRLLKKTSQLANADKTLCRDCV